MIDLSTPNEWQHIDPSNGLVMPWYTKPALDEIVTWDLKDKVVFEYGCGASTLWWRKKAKEVYGVEYSYEYWRALMDHRPWSQIVHTENEEKYIRAPFQFEHRYDIIAIDGSFRDACVPIALECLKPGGKLIFDNWMQPEVEMQTEETQRLVLALPHTIYKQEGHPYWQTLIATKL
jgi:hypothetical protein